MGEYSLVGGVLWPNTLLSLFGGYMHIKLCTVPTNVIEARTQRAIFGYNLYKQN